jgi:hypothetical protein
LAIQTAFVKEKGKTLKGGVLILKLLLKRKKKDLLQEFDILDVFSEQNLLSESDKTHLNDYRRANSNLAPGRN